MTLHRQQKLGLTLTTATHQAFELNTQQAFTNGGGGDTVMSLFVNESVMKYQLPTAEPFVVELIPRRNLS